MFTALCWFFLAIFRFISANCWLAGKTRNSNEICYGRCQPLTPGLARTANLPEETMVCLRHRRAIERQDDRCSSPFEERHSKKLTAIPVSLYGILDKKGKTNKNYQPGSKWCNACKGKFYKNAEGDSDVTITTRRKVTLIIPFPKQPIN